MNKPMTLTQGRVLPTLLRFALPMFLANLLQTLYGTVDTLVVGNFSDTAAVSAVSCGSQILWIVTALMMGLTTGATVLIGQQIGAGENRQAARTVGTAAVLFTLLALASTVICLFFYPAMLGALQVPVEAMGPALSYTRICVLGIPLIIGYNTVCAILRGLGDSRGPLLFVAVACVVNVAGDLLLTGYLGMGATGVAIATVAAQGVSFLLALVYMARATSNLMPHRKDLRWDAPLVKRILKLGAPLALQNIMVNLSFLLMTAIINTMGVTASAAMGIGDKTCNFAGMPIFAFSSAVSVMVAQNAGAGEVERCKKTVVSATLCSLVIGVLFTAVCLVCPTILPRIFTKDPAVIALTGSYVLACALDLLVCCLMMPLNSMFSGFGHASFSMAQNLAATFLVRVPLTFFFSRLPGATLFHVVLASPISTLFSLVLCLIFYKTGRWKKLAS